jgi:AraC family transcriptional regulator of adaptative response / DNA-3-methyladenine glycosylase II
MIKLSLPYRPPLDWDGLLDYYRRHRVAGVETIEAGTYSRVFKLGEPNANANAIGFFRVRPHANKPELLLEMTISDTRHLLRAVQRVRHMFDLDSDPVLIANAFAQSKLLASLQQKLPGVRLARGFDAFETAVATILGQHVSVKHGSCLMSQLVETYGGEIDHPVSGERFRVFPTPSRLAESDLRELQTTTLRRATIREFSSHIAKGAIHLERAQNQEDFKAAVQTVKGIGAWSAEYMALRALGDTDAFPATDLVLKRFAKAHPDFDPDIVRPWRGYVAVYLWTAYVDVYSKERKNRHAVL